MKTLLAVLALVSGMSAYAQEESTTKTKTSEVMKGEQPKSQEDIDNEITNAKMRAESGSKSKHSLSISAGYNGGTLDDAFGETRPSLAPGEVVKTSTSADAGVSYRYRLTAADSLTAGIGISMTKPGHDGSENEIDNPNVAYSRSYKISGIQNITAVGSTKYTSEQLVDGQKLNADFGAGQTALMELGTSGWQLGLAVDATYYNYTEYVEGQTEYMLGLYPFVEYAINDMFNFRTVYRGNTYFSTRENNAAFTQLEPTQSMGLGIAATRDIFLYPNVQWVWRDIDAEKTNVALSATMNFF